MCSYKKQVIRAVIEPLSSQVTSSIVCPCLKYDGLSGIINCLFHGFPVASLNAVMFLLLDQQSGNSLPDELCDPAVDILARLSGVFTFITLYK